MYHYIGKQEMYGNETIPYDTYLSQEVVIVLLLYICIIK
jgi:hypothetical protein